MRARLLVYIENGDGQLWERGEFNPTEEQERDWIKGMKEDPDELLLVAEYEGTFVGNTDFHIGKHKRLAHVGEFGMSCMPDWRGKGLGEVLLSELLRFFYPWGLLKRTKNLVPRKGLEPSCFWRSPLNRVASTKDYLHRNAGQHKASDSYTERYPWRRYPKVRE